MSADSLSSGKFLALTIVALLRRDRVRNDDIRDRVGVAPIEEKLIQHRLR
jgi:hypothetical protein